MKTTVKIMALLLTALLLFPTLLACKPIGGTDETTPDDTAQPIDPEIVPTAPAEGATVYNIIFALATIPPVLAALDCIGNGYDTYAIIERGKTYNGIESIEHFYNAGFDPASNLSTGFTQTEFETMVEKVKELKAATEGEVFFYFYAQDGTALRAAAIAANASLDTEDFHIIMCEDGTGAYDALNNYYIKNKNVSDNKDEPFDYFVALRNEVGHAFEDIMAKTDNKNGDPALSYSIRKAYALASLSNFTYWLQNKETVKGILEGAESGKTKLLGVFGADGYENETAYTVNLKYQTIAEGMNKLNAEQKEGYLTLMYGQYYEDTYAALTRTERAGESAPADKLVFIGARHGYYPTLASDEIYGIGGLAETDTVPQSYGQLDAKYKSELLFATEADYNAFLSAINNANNYSANLDADVKTKVQVACFNHYINYIYALKFTYALYGDDHDIILKGHPMEVIGASSEWGNRYAVSWTEGEGENATEKKYVYDKLLDNALLAFHASDSTGKYIGMVPYGTAAENLAYIGIDISICGLPSSTYSGYDTDVDVLFILTATDEAINGDASQVKERYEAGNLTYTDGEETLPCVFYNTGNFYKYAAKLLKDAGNNTLAAEYEARFEAWLDAVHPSAGDVDAQGFAK